MPEITDVVKMELATWSAHQEALLDAALAGGDDETPFTQLPAYALAARLDALLRSTRTWHVPVAADLAS